MKSVIEEYGFLIVELLCGLAISSLFILVLSKLGVIANFVAERLMGG